MNIKKIISIFVSISLISASFAAFAANESGLSEEQYANDNNIALLADDELTETISIPVEADTFVQNNNGTAHGEDQKLLTLANGGNASRWIILKFNLPEIQDTDAVISANLCVTGTSDSLSVANRHNWPFAIRHYDDDDWDESTLANTPQVGKLLVQPKGNLSISDVDNPIEEDIYKVDITNLVRAEYYDDPQNILSIVLESHYSGGSNTWGTIIWSKEAELDDIFKPHIELEIKHNAEENLTGLINDWAALKLGEASEFEATEITDNMKLPKKGENGSDITWLSSNPDVITNEGDVILPDYKTGAQTVTLTAEIENGDNEYITKAFLFTVKPLIEDEDILLMERDEIIKRFNNVTANDNLDFYTEGVTKDENGKSNGVKISWSSSDTSVITNEGKVILFPAGEQGKNIDVTVTVRKGKSELDFNINIFVPSESSLSMQKAAHNSLIDIVKYCDEYAKTLHADGTAGAVQQNKLEDFNTALDAAKKLCESDGEALATYDSAIQNLTSAGLLLFEDMVLDDSLIEGTQDNERVFSEYRAKAMQLVFDGEITMRTYPELYTDGDRYELRDKIDYTKSVLDGTYKRRFNRSREFIRPRKDEMLQRCIYNAYMYNPAGRVYGYGAESRFDLEQTLTWYKTTNVLSQAYHIIELDPVFDGEMGLETTNENPKNSVSSIGNLASYRGVYHPQNYNDAYIAKFDISGIDKVITGISMALSNSSDSDRYRITYEIIQDDYDDKIKTGVNLKDLTKGTYVDNNDAYAVIKDGGEAEMISNTIASSWSTESAMPYKGTRTDTDITAALQKDKNNIISVLIHETYANQNVKNHMYTSTASDEAVRPKLCVKVSNVDMDKLKSRIDYLEDRYEEFLKWYERGEDGLETPSLGKVPADKYDAAEDAMDAVLKAWNDSEEAYIIASHIVKAYNAMRTARQSKTLLSDIEPDTNIFFTKEDSEKLRNAIKQDSTKTEVYNSIKTSADGTSIEAFEEQLPLLGRDNYIGMGFTPQEWMFDEKGDVSVDYVQKHWKYSTNSTIKAQTAPKDAATMRLELNIPEGEYEALGEGQGHVWFDNITGFGSETPSLDIPNPSFETGDQTSEGVTGWTYLTNEPANSEFKIETARNLVQHGARSAYLANKSSTASSSLISDQIKINAGEQYSVTMYARLDRVLIGNNKEPLYDDSGVRIIIHWYDKDGTEISSSTRWHNKRAGTGPLANQADAIVYFMTGDITYAKKAKYGILLKLNDLAQGAEEWIMRNTRPNEVDAYGGVQIGRNLCVLAQSYSLIKNSGVFSEYEQELYESLLSENIRFVADGRDRSELTPETFSNVGNWATDSWAGTALSVMALPEYKDSRQYLDNAHRLLSNQIDCAIGENGTYPESTRYMWAGITRFALYAYCNGSYEGMDTFGKTYLSRLFDYAIDVLTPFYSYINRSSNPNFGDNSLREGSFGVAAAYLDQINKVNPELAQKIYRAWENQGKPAISYSSEEPGFPGLFVPVEFEADPSFKLDLKTQANYRESIGPIFRQNYGVQGKEMYFAINTPERALAHMHNDLGSIIFYANSEPMIMDPGVESYFDNTSLGWFKGSQSHSVLQFKNTNGEYVSAPNPSSAQAEIQEFVSNSNIDYTKIRIPHYIGNSLTGTHIGTQMRHAAYIKGGINALIVWDDVTSDKAARINWGTPAKSVSQVDNKFISYGHFNTDLETTVLPEDDSSRKLSTYWGGMTPNAWPQIIVNGQRDTYINMEYIEQDAGKDFFTVHYPKEKTAARTLEASTLYKKGNIGAYKLKLADNFYVLSCVNGGERKGTISLEDNVGYNDLITGEHISGNIQLAAGEMRFLQPDSIEQSRPNSIQISGVTTVSSSDDVDVTSPYQALVLDQYGSVMENQNIEWSVSGNNASISENGILTIKAGALAGDITISAKSGDISSSFKVAVVKAERYRSSIEITGPLFVAYSGSAVNVNYNANVYDQFGQIYSNDKVKWSVEGDNGFSINSNGVLSISANLEEGASAVITAKSVYNEFVTNSVRITIGPSAPAAINVNNDIKAVALPKKNNLKLSFAAEVTDQNGNKITDGEYGKLNYKVNVPSSLSNYVVIDEKTGELIISAVPDDVSKSLIGHTITVTVSCEADSKIKTDITLTIKDIIISKLEISGNSSITSLSKGTNTADYIVRAYDQNGDVVANYNKLKWSIANGLIGVYIDNGKLTVTSYAQPGTAVIKVIDTEDGVSSNISVTIVKDKKEEQTNDKEVVSAGGGRTNGGNGSNALGDYSNRLPALSADSALPPVNGGEQNYGLFDDLPMSHWAADAVYKLRDQGIIYGRSDKLFAPTENVTRAEFVSMLVRAFDIKGSGIASKFDDVTMNDWFYDAVSVCVEHRIVSGVDEIHFMPNDIITRQDMCVMLYRIFEYLDIKTQSLQELSFNDKGEISEYALSAVLGMTGEGILSGYEDKTFRPKNNASRAEAAKVIDGAVNKLKEE